MSGYRPPTVVAMHPMTYDPRSAGGVVRYHAWPCIRQQSVAEHSWNVARILLAIWPKAPAELVREALLHDIGERVTGDVPYPVKRNNPALKLAMDVMEAEGRRGMAHWGVPEAEELKDFEKLVLKAADCLEMWEYACDELALGNMNMHVVRARMSAATREYSSEIRKTYGTIADRIHDYMQKRINHDRAYRRAYVDNT